MTITANKKRCPRCRQHRDPSWFSRDYCRPDGRACWCKVCSRRAYRERSWGIPQAEFDKLIDAQGGGCAICRTLLEAAGTYPWTRMDRTEDGRIRGAVCRECKAGLVGFRSDPERLRAAVEYLAGTSFRT
jgi:hypothetical protein